MYQSFNSDKLNYLDFFFETADGFGGKGRSDKRRYVERRNIGKSNGDAFPEKGAYFGCISKGEENRGAYSDLCVVIFPSNEPEDADDRWLVALAVGSLGFKDDYDIVTLPGTRRLFIRKMYGNKTNTFIKNDFLDVESNDGFKKFRVNNNFPETLSNAVKNYEKEILVSTIIDPNNQKATEDVVKRYLGLYATIREWPSNKSNRKNVKEALAVENEDLDEEKEIKKLLYQRKYIVLQGAPGTGKTRMAKQITKHSNKVFFTQFHAETSYSDFIYGILPDVQEKELKYKDRKGIFVKAIQAAQENKNEKVYLIIDEINRANLSNVLGPAFYLFEPNMSDGNAQIEICPNLSLKKLPDNLYVIATMNTADRSLAVIDFALRRRFAWYTMMPHEIKVGNGYEFCAKEFNEIRDIFEKYATDEEMNLQPGQAYFIVSQDNKEEEINERLKYEIMPLIKEYLDNGMLSRSKDDFTNYFRNRIHEEMYK